MRKEDDKSEEEEEIEDVWIIVPPDGGWGWVIVFAAFACCFIADGFLFTFGLFLKPLSNELGITIGKVSIINSVTQAFYFFSGPFVSAFVNRFGSRIVAFTGGVLLSFGYACAACVYSIESLIVMNGLLPGIGVCMIYAVANVLPGFYFGRWRALAISLASTGSTLGTMTLSPITEYILERYGWRNTYLIISVCMAVICLMALLLRPLKPVKLLESEGMPKYASIVHPKKGKKKDSKTKWYHLHRATRILFFWLDVKLLKSLAFHLFLWNGCFLLAGYVIPLVYIKDRAVGYEIPDQDAVWVLSFIGFGNTVGRITGGILSSCVSNLDIVLYSAICLFICGILSILSGQQYFTTVGFQLTYAFLFGFNVACICLRAVIVVQLFGLKNLTNGFGLMLLFMGIGSFVSVYIGGQMFDSVGNYDAVFCLGGGAMIISAALLIFVKYIRNWEKKRDILT